MGNSDDVTPRAEKHQGIGSDDFKERIGGQKPDVSTSILGYQVGACQAGVEGGQGWDNRPLGWLLNLRIYG